MKFCIHALVLATERFQPHSNRAHTARTHTCDRTYEYLYQFYWAKNELALDKQRVHLTPGLSALWLAAPKSHCHGLLFVYMHGYSCNKRRRRSGISSYLLFLPFFFFTLLTLFKFISHFYTNAVYAMWWLLKNDERTHSLGIIQTDNGTNYERFFAPCV